MAYSLKGFKKYYASRGETSRNVKLGFGGIREIEFIVQTLQLSFGKRLPRIRERNTLNALSALFRYKMLSEEEFQALSGAYLFLRDVENKLQMVYDFQIHSLPDDNAELRACALRMGYRDLGQARAEEKFMRDYKHHTGCVNRIFQEVFNSAKASRFSGKGGATA